DGHMAPPQRLSGLETDAYRIYHIRAQVWPLFHSAAWRQQAVAGRVRTPCPAQPIHIGWAENVRSVSRSAAFYIRKTQVRLQSTPPSRGRQDSRQAFRQ